MVFDGFPITIRFSHWLQGAFGAHCPPSGPGVGNARNSNGFQGGPADSEEAPRQHPFPSPVPVVGNYRFSLVFYKVFLLTIRFPGRAFFWPAKYAYLTMALKHFWRGSLLWPFDVDSLSNASSFHVIYIVITTYHHHDFFRARFARPIC